MRLLLDANLNAKLLAEPDAKTPRTSAAQKTADSSRGVGLSDRLLAGCQRSCKKGLVGADGFEPPTYAL